MNIGRIYPSGVHGRMPRLIEAAMERWSTGVPGMARIQLADLRLAWLMTRLFQHLHMRRTLALTVIQREMVATVVNGAIGGPPDSACNFHNFSSRMEAASGLPMDGPQLGDQLVRMHRL
ncbi:MAG: hypothetical protein M3R21_00920 [Candidatus Dormibacteraeota bacterium]|nr:hypothetical protein [Candidatus Dormibacteraeota bacterium]